MSTTSAAGVGDAAASRATRAKVIEVRDLTRRFGDFTALDSISFEVFESEVFAFLGPNGAEKSTTIKMLCTLAEPSAGRLSVPTRSIDGDCHPSGEPACHGRSEATC